MKKVILFVMMVAISVMVLSGCGHKKVNVMGRQCESSGIGNQCEEPDASEDFTHGLYDNNNSGNSGNNGGNHTNNHSSSNTDNLSYQNGAVVNHTGHDIVVKFVAAYTPDGYNIRQDTENFQLYSNGYRTISVEVKRKSEVKIRLKPAKYDTHTSMTNRGLYHNEAFTVYLNPGMHTTLSGEVYDFVYDVYK